MDKRQDIIGSHRKTVLQMREIEEKIESLLAAQDPQWRQLEAQRNELRKKIEPLIEQYWQWLPAVELSKCPYCEKALLRSFDNYDLDGFWWMDRTQRTHQEPNTCEHFCLLSGALNFNGQEPKGGLFECRPGPDKPFVYPRVMEMPSIHVVISEIQMACGYIAYPIAYFSKQPLEGHALTQSWARKEYTFTLEDGRSGWNIREESQDFDLKAWVSFKRISVFRGEELKFLNKDDPILKIKGKEKNQKVLNNVLSFDSFVTN